MFVSDILSQKGGLVFTVTPGTTVAQISRQLSARRIGSVLVVDRLDRIAGIVSERDVVRAMAGNAAAVTAKTAFSRQRQNIARWHHCSTRLDGWQMMSAPCRAKERAASG